MRMFGVLFGIMVLATTASATVSLPCAGDTEAEAEAKCAALAKGGHGVAICGGLVDVDVENRAKAICGSAIAACEQGDVFRGMAFSSDRPPARVRRRA